jgi:cytochrome d ubiquinol oxidase subunit II
MYIFLQQYWWLVVSLLGAILVFLLFVQGGNSLLFCLGKTEEHRKMMVNSTGRKWEFTFTTLVTFGGAFFASFPLFYSTSFGGAYWLWMIILFSFVLQAVSYEFQSKAGNLLGKKTYRTFLVINGVVGPVLLGGAVATFFTGSDFYINKANMTDTIMPVISHWGNGWHGLDALTNIWNVILGLAVFFLARVLGSLYFINNIDDKELTDKCRRAVRNNTVLFLVFFLAFVIRTLVSDGFAVNPDTQEIYMQPYKYLTNFIEMPVVLALFLIGVVLIWLHINFLCIRINGKAIRYQCTNDKCQKEYKEQNCIISYCTTTFIGQLFIINIINEIERSQHTGKEEDSQSKNNIPNVGQCIQSVPAISPMTDYRHNGICHIGLINIEIRTGKESSHCPTK